MKTLIPKIHQELAAGRAVALATVLQAVGSAPRGAGACQLMLENGQDVGTVGGGLIERRALDELAKMLRQWQETPMPSAEPAPTTLNTVRSSFAIPCPTGTASAVQEYALTQDDVLSLGMVCGGSVRVLYQLLTPAMLPFFTALATAVQTAKTNLWLIRGIRAGQSRIHVHNG